MRTLIWCLACCRECALRASAAAQSGRLAIEYTVKVADIPGQLFHVTTDIRNINQPALELSLPVWSPGWYVIENYAKNVARFRVTEPGGRELRPAQVRKQTWRIDTRGISRITVEFDYLATVLSANQARIAPDYAFFTGTQLFLLPEGHRSRPSIVRFDVPSGWKIASGLDETADPMVFTAPEYDTLVDQPTLMGQFDVTRFMVDGKPHDLVANPAGRVLGGEDPHADRPPHEAGGNAGQDLRRPARIGSSSTSISSGPPEARCRGAGAPELVRRPLEPRRAAAARRHGGRRPRTSSFTSGTSSASVRWRCGPTTTRGRTRRRCCGCPRASRRITPACRRIAPGFKDARDFVEEVAREIGEVEGNEARRYISASDSSTSTWIGYATPPPFSISYYSQGRNLAALLDLSIRHDTDGASGLDDVMRALFTDFYQRGRGFSTEDLIRVDQPHHQEVVRRLLQPVRLGTDVPPYDTIFGYAGYQAVRATRSFPILGVNLNEMGRVTGVPPGYDAAAARLQQDDFIVSVDGQTLEGQGAWRPSFRLLSEKLGKNVRLRIRRGNEDGRWISPSERSNSLTIASSKQVADTGTVEDPGKLAQTLAPAGTFQLEILRVRAVRVEPDAVQRALRTPSTLSCVRIKPMSDF